MMHRMNRAKRSDFWGSWAGWIVACVVVVGMASAVKANGNVVDVVDEVNASRGTVVIGGETLQVTSSSRLEDAAGSPLPLMDLNGTKNTGRGDIVEYSIVGRPGAGSQGALREIQALRVIEGDYE